MRATLRALMIVAAVSWPFVLVMGVGVYGDYEHQQRVRVSSAFGDLHTLRDRWLASNRRLDRRGLHLPHHVHDTDDNDIADMPAVTDYTLDFVRGDFVATFGADQRALTGRTIYLRPSADGTSSACGGTAPEKYLPMACRRGHAPVVVQANCPNPASPASKPGP